MKSRDCRQQAQKARLQRDHTASASVVWTSRPRCSGPLSASRWPGACGSRSQALPRYSSHDVIAKYNANFGEAHGLHSKVNYCAGISFDPNGGFSNTSTSAKPVHNANRLKEAHNAKIKGDACQVESQQAETESLPRRSPQERPDRR